VPWQRNGQKGGELSWGRGMEPFYAPGGLGALVLNDEDERKSESERVETVGEHQYRRGAACIVGRSNFTLTNGYVTGTTRDVHRADDAPYNVSDAPLKTRSASASTRTSMLSAMWPTCPSHCGQDPLTSCRRGHKVK
jgi:hypothetical protein